MQDSENKIKPLKSKYQITSSRKYNCQLRFLDKTR